MNNGDQKCDAAFIEEVKWRWEFEHTIDAYNFPRLLALAEKGAIFEFHKKE
jgi:hypothetical protein